MRVVVQYQGSGKKKGPQFEQMMLAASQRQFDVLLFWSLDRLSREGVLPTLTYLQRLDGYGVTGLRSPSSTWIRLASSRSRARNPPNSRQAGTSAHLGGCSGWAGKAKEKGKTLGRPAVRSEHDKDAKQIKAMRDAGYSYESIADELGRSKSDVYRVCQTLGCSAAT